MMSAPPTAESLQVNFKGLGQSISFEAALRAASPESSVESVTTQSRASLFTLDRGSQSALPTGGSVRDQGALVLPPTLDHPTVDTERRSVTITWARHPFGGVPSFWRLGYTTPGGGGGEVVLPGTTTSITERLPADGIYTVRVRACDADGCSDWSETRTFELRPAGPPGRPTFCSATANGLVVTLSWGAPAPNTGGAVITYVVLFEGVKYPVGLITTISGTVAPGRYLIGVLARNASGDSAAATCEVTVEGGGGTYSGSFDGTGPFSRTGTSCTWQVTFRGTITLTLTQGSSGLTGTIRVNGTWSTPSPSSLCLAGSGSYDSTNPVIISGTNVARTGIPMSLATGTFSGNLAGNTVTGTLSARYNLGTGNVVMGATLRR